MGGPGGWGVGGDYCVIGLNQLPAYRSHSIVLILSVWVSTQLTVRFRCPLASSKFSKRNRTINDNEPLLIALFIPSSKLRCMQKQLQPVLPLSSIWIK